MPISDYLFMFVTGEAPAEVVRPAPTSTEPRVMGFRPTGVHGAPMAEVSGSGGPVIGGRGGSGIRTGQSTRI